MSDNFLTIKPLGRRSNAKDLMRNLMGEFDEMGRMFEQLSFLHGMPTIEGINGPNFVPPLQFAENEKEYLVEIEIPGINKENVNVEIINAENNNKILSITGKKESKKTEKNETYHINEMFYGEFRRELVLPIDVDVENINAEHGNGLLKLTIPKELKEIEKKEIKKINIK